MYIKEDAKPWRARNLFIFGNMDSPSLAAQHLPLLSNFWQAQLQNIEQGELDFKNYQLPLARIKKVMKTDEDVKHMMISAEVKARRRC